MAVQKNKVTRSKRDMRRSHHALRTPALSISTRPPARPIVGIMSPMRATNRGHKVVESRS